MDGWTGRYGKPLELSLALHLSTMAPDLAYTICAHPVFDTKMHIGAEKIEYSNIITWQGLTLEDIQQLEKEGQTAGDLGISSEQLSDLKSYMSNGETTTTYQPYIMLVQKSWYYGLMVFEYENTFATTSNSYSPDNVPDELADLQSDIYIVESNVGARLQQTSEPTIHPPTPNDAIKALFVGGATSESIRDKDVGYVEVGLYNKKKIAVDPESFEDFDGLFYKYDGTKLTAKKIAEAKAIDAGESTYKWENVDIPVESKKIERTPIQTERTVKERDEQTGELVEKITREFSSAEKTSAMQAFSLLENMHTQDSEYILRNLKDLFVELKYFKRKDFEVPETQVLKWILPGYAPPIWPAQDKDLYGSFLKYQKESDTEDEDKYEFGFQEGMELVAPGKGIIETVDADSITIKFTEPELLKDITMYISGFDVDSSITIGKEIEPETLIGTTRQEDIQIVMRDQVKAILDNIGDYMKPDKVTTSGFGGEFHDFLVSFEGEGPEDATGQYYKVYGGDGALTVGPGVTHYNNGVFSALGYSQHQLKSVGQLIPKNIVMEVYYEVIKSHIEAVEAKAKSLNLTLLQHQIDAMASFHYNCGNINGLLEAYMSGANQQQKNQNLWNLMSQYVWGEDDYGNTVYYPGLARRRKAEYELFTTGNYGADGY